MQKEIPTTYSPADDDTEFVPGGIVIGHGPSAGDEIPLPEPFIRIAAALERIADALEKARRGAGG